VTTIERTGLVKYDAMQRAIMAAHAVDEVKGIRDKAQALEAYAKQARNIDAERRAADIRIRAELKAGELLKVAQKAKGARSQLNGRGRIGPRSVQAPIKTLDELGVSETQSSRWQQLARAPKQVENYLTRTAEEGGIPTTAGALAAAAPTPNVHRLTPTRLPFSRTSLWVCSRLADLVAQIDENATPEVIANGCDEDMRAEMRAHSDKLFPLLKKLRGLL